MTYTHTLTTTQNGKSCPPTNAEFCNIVNDKAGLLIAVNNFGPAVMVHMTRLETEKVGSVPGSRI